MKSKLPRFTHGTPSGKCVYPCCESWSSNTKHWQKPSPPPVDLQHVVTLLWHPMLFPGQYKYCCKRLCYVNVPEEGSICLGISLWHSIVLLRNALKQQINCWTVLLICMSMIYSIWEGSWSHTSLVPVFHPCFSPGDIQFGRVYWSVNIQLPQHQNFWWKVDF